MADKPDSDKLKGSSAELRTGPGGMSMRELHELVKRSHLRDQAGGKARNKFAQPQSRWQRLVRYVWDKKKG
jgi:hypothetical protein